MQRISSYRRHDARRRRRYEFRSRLWLLSILVGLEALGCGAMLMLASWFLNSRLGTVAAASPSIMAAVAIYALLAISPAQKVLSRGEPPRFAAGQALLSVVTALAMSNLLQMLLLAGPTTPPFGWGELAFVVPFAMVLRLVLYHCLNQFMLAGRLQIERFGLVGQPDAIRRFQGQSAVWKRGAQVVATHNILQPFENLPLEFIQACIDKRCDSVIFAGTPEEYSSIFSVVADFAPYDLNVVFAPVSDNPERLLKYLDVLPFGPANSVRVQRKPLDEIDRAMKRALDLFASLALIIVLSPVLLAIGLLIRITSTGPAFYWQERRGFNGKLFWMIKFRSMNVMEDGRDMTPAKAADPRITPLGRFLRRTSLDELPQLFNVVRGDMSLVGPRPHAVSDDAVLSERFALYANRQRIKPGITGWAQVNGYRGDFSTQERIEGRTLHDLHYVSNYSIGLDIRILLLTAFSRKSRENAR